MRLVKFTEDQLVLLLEFREFLEKRLPFLLIQLYDRIQEEVPLTFALDRSYKSIALSAVVGWELATTIQT